MGAVAPSLSSLTMHSVTSILASSEFYTIFEVYVSVLKNCKILTEFIFTTFSQTLALVSFGVCLRNKIGFSVSYSTQWAVLEPKLTAKNLDYL